MKWALILFFSILSGLTSAQYTFRYEYDSIRTLPSSFVEVDDGFVIASAKHPNQGDYEMAKFDSQLIKINRKGEFQWAIKINEPNYDNVFSIKYDGQHIFGVGIGDDVNNDRHTYFLKFDKQGSLLFKKQIGTSALTPRDNLPMNLVIKKDGTILINNSEYNFTTGNTECVVYRLNKNGEILNRTTFSQTTLSCVPYDLIESTDNGFVVVMSALDLNLLEEEIYLLKFNEGGSEVWRKLIQTIDPVQTDFSLCELNNSIYCAMATSYVNGGPSRLSLVKYDVNGTNLFESNYANYSPPEPESFDFPKISINQDSTGLLIFGSFAGAQTVFNPTLLFTDFSGNIYKSVGIPYQHTLGNGWAIDMNPTNDNGIALLNRNFSYLTQVSEYTELVKLDCQGNFEWKDECSFVETKSDVLFYPNPSTGQIKIEALNNPLNGQLKLTNLEGRDIYNVEIINKKDCVLNFENLPSGVYFIEFQSGKNKISKKWIKL